LENGTNTSLDENSNYKLGKSALKMYYLLLSSVKIYEMEDPALKFIDFFLIKHLYEPL